MNLLREAVNKMEVGHALANAGYCCFTSDIDWATESMIQETLLLFNKYSIPLTPFVTYKSETIRKEYRNRERYVGLQPDFMGTTTRSNDAIEIIDNLLKLNPQAKCFRSHDYFDSSLVTTEFMKRGFKYDSNLCLYLQPNIEPLWHWSGLLRFPVFFEDYAHMTKNKPWTVTEIPRMLELTGMKIFNFHPVHICLNSPTLAYYEKIKNKIYSDNADVWRKYIYKGKGTRYFLIELLENARANTGFKFMYLDDLYLAVSNVVEYKQASAQIKQSIVRNVYAKRDAANIYATSPDLNLRELEIDFIIKYIQLYAKKNPEKTLQILDIGCGNGYTDIRIAQVANVAITGVDFSENMIEAANNLKTKLGRLHGRLSFHLTDATKLSGTESFDVIITERLLLNLPNLGAQEDTIQTIHRLLKPNGMYIFVEGTLDGLERLNKLRLSVGLDPIPDRSTANISSLKFHEKEIIPFLSRYFAIVKRQYFGMYFLISRVAHPLLIYPEEPRYDATINQVARKISSVNPDYKHLGHIMGLILMKK